MSRKHDKGRTHGTPSAPPIAPASPAHRTPSADENSLPTTFTCADGTQLPVSVRLSTRAKHWRLTLSHTGDLEVVIPAAGRRQSLRPAPAAEVTAFIESHRSWVERTAKRTKPQREAYEESQAAGLPTRVDFPLANELWLVTYHPTQAKSITIKPDGLRRIEGTKSVYALKLSGATGDEDFCKRALVRFVANRAKQVIPPFAWDVCREIEARPTSITVNNRKSAWGVCTQSGAIRIDRRVMFLPQGLARQIVLHEAAHLKHLNHSANFYAELYSYQDSTPQAEQAVKKAIHYIPAWFIDGA